MENEELLDRITRLELSLKQHREYCDGLEMAISWLLAKHPGDEALLFLSSQANEFEGAKRLEEITVALDYLREDVYGWRALWSDAPHEPPEKS
jgi:hypothetical protein